jgi:predicted membrane protein
MDERANPLSGRLIVGIALMALGALWTLDNLGLAQAGEVLRWWPVLPLAVGLMKLTGVGMEKQVPFGAFLAIIGGLLLLGELDFVHVGFGIIFPLLFIFMGVQLTMRAMRGSERVVATGPADTDDYVNSFAAMGGLTRRNDSQAFRGGELSAVMGGIQLDLSNAKPADGRAVVEVLAIWGGIEIRVPEDWRVEIEATPVMGGVECNARLAPGVEPVGTLVVRGFVLMGGVEIKNTPLKDMQAGVVVRTGELRRRVRGEETREGTVVTKEVRVGVTGIEVKREIVPPAAPPPSPQPPVEPQ